MPDILVRDVSARTKERPKQRARRHGKSLEADLRDTLEASADEDRHEGQKKIGFGTRLVGISRPGADLDDALSMLRSARPRRAELE